ncbi:hypothetical protein BB560_005165 [Smittium megazygosporum]|uniref:Amino acid transporter transmembrane domain-containing protein n=1 Tax=Smittium megazygosporum TaxID=133381 RepID=A0A2T9Z7D2_9FUNG|nr:hypothetical protein BB560_005165 [Smittium megazygosporum]
MPEIGLTPYQVGFNILNTIIGSGIIGLPYAIKEAGFWFGMLLLIAVGILCKTALEILILCGEKLNSFDFGANLEKTAGKSGRHLLNFALCINGFGSCITYLMISTDIMYPVLFPLTPTKYQVFLTRTNLMLLISAVFVLPLLFFKNLDPLSRFSTFSILLVPTVILILVLRAPTYFVSIPPLKIIGGNPVPAIGIIAFAMVCTQTSYQNYKGLRGPSPIKDWETASKFAIKFAVSVYTSFSLLGYLIFGMNSQPNILNNFAKDDAGANLARVLMAISIILTYPMQFYPTREILNSIIHLKLGKRSYQNTLDSARNEGLFSPSPAELEETSANSPNLLDNALSLVWFGSTVIVSILVTDLGVVYKLLGALSASLLAFILPSWMYLSMNSSYFNPEYPTESSQLIQQSQTLPRVLSRNNLDRNPEYFTVVSKFMFALGVFVLVIGTINTVLY